MERSGILDDRTRATPYFAALHTGYIFNLKPMKKLFILFFALAFSAQAAAEDQAIAEIFSRHGLDGTMVVSSLHGGQRFTHNDLRAGQRFTAASTFKILNTLIALEEHAIAGKDAVFKWDGHVYALADWNHDQTLASAFKVSCVWCFQELARRVGAEKYRDYLRKTAYGELREPFEVAEFWLDGSLTISAVEQVEFLKKIHRRSLPFSAASYDTLREIMQVEQTPAYTLWAKTGFATRLKPQTGWYVGYVETSTDAWFFAMNAIIRSDADLPLRIKLAREVLQSKGIIQ